MKVSHLIPGGHGLTDKQAEKRMKREISSKYGRDNGKHSFLVNNVEQPEKMSPIDILKLALTYDKKNNIIVTIWDFTDTNFKTAMKSSELSKSEKAELENRVYGLHDSTANGKFHFKVRQSE